MDKKFSYEELSKRYETLKSFAMKRYTFCDECEQRIKVSDDRINVTLNGRMIAKYCKDCYPLNNAHLEIIKAIEEENERNIRREVPEFENKMG